LPLDILICNTCLIVVDRDKKNQKSLNYQPSSQRALTISFDHSYVLCNNHLYLAKEYNELGILYHEARENLSRLN
ncbi:16900_t:CDS:1, partial [Funneliformis geosporum]